MLKNATGYQAEALRTAPRGPAYPEGISGPGAEVFDRMIWAMGLAGEAGEVADYLKKVYGHGHPIDREKVKKELGDVRWYGAVLAAAFGFTEEEIEQANVAKLRARYPDGFTVAGSLERKDQAPTFREDNAKWAAEEHRKALERAAILDTEPGLAVITSPPFADLPRVEQIRAAKIDQVAQRLFEVYNEQGPNPWKTFDGREVPRWPELTDQVRAKWRAAAEEAIALGAKP